MKIPSWFERQVNTTWPFLRLRFERWAEPEDGFLPVVGPPFQRTVQLDGTVMLRNLMPQSKAEAGKFAQPLEHVCPGRVVVYEKHEGQMQSVVDLVSPYGKPYDLDFEARLAMAGIAFRVHREDVDTEMFKDRKDRRVQELTEKQAEGVADIGRDWMNYLNGQVNFGYAGAQTSMRESPIFRDNPKLARTEGGLIVSKGLV